MEAMKKPGSIQALTGEPARNRPWKRSMLKSLTVRGFKSLTDATIEFPRMAVLFGPNAAGNSNLLDAIQALSRIGTQRTLADALGDPIRGYPIEGFSFPPGGLTELLSRSSAQFSLAADLTGRKDSYRYRVDVEIGPLTPSGSGSRARRVRRLIAGVSGHPARASGFPPRTLLRRFFAPRSFGLRKPGATAEGIRGRRFGARLTNRPSGSGVALWTICTCVQGDGPS